MTTYLRNNTPESTDAIIKLSLDSWDLDEQLGALLEWLSDNPDFNSNGDEWIVDIGFEPRQSATVAGYTVSVELMAALCSRNITLWLSDYLNEK